MRRMREWWRRVIGSVNGQGGDTDLAAELDAHLQMQIDDFVRRGMSPADARREAGRRLGAIEAGKEAYRDQRGWRPLDVLLRDIRHTGRLVAKSPGFYLSVVGVLAGTIALCVVMFSAVYALLLRPLPYADPARLVRVHETNPGGHAFAVSLANYFSWREASGNDASGREVSRRDTAPAARGTAVVAPTPADAGDASAMSAFDALALYQARTVEIGDDQPERVQGVRVTASLFDVLRVRPALGRPFRASEDQAGQASPVVMLTHGLWMRRFGGRPDLLGQTIRVNEVPHTVIGILAPDFEFPAAPREFGGQAIELLTPASWTMEERSSRGSHSWQAIGRLRDGVSLAQADDVMTRVAAQLARTFESNRRWGAQVQPLGASIFGRTARMLWMLLAGVGALLLLGCANVANLLLARGVSRRRELALRAAIGGSGRRLLLQMFTESVTLSLAAALLGLALAHSGLRALIALAPRDLPRLANISIDGVVVAVTVGLAVATGIVIGVLPAFQARRAQPGTLLGGGRGHVSHVSQRAQATLIVSQLAITVVLLIAAGLLLRTAVALQRSDIGFESSHRLTFRLAVDAERYPGDTGQWQFLDRALTRLRALPGIDHAAAASNPPLVSGDSLLSYFVYGQPRPEPGEMTTALFYRATPDYFRTLGIPLRAGRAFTNSDRTDSTPVVIINEYLAKQTFGQTNPVGQRLSIFSSFPSEIVGVVGDTKHYGLDRPEQAQVYFAYAQFSSDNATVIVDTRLPRETALPMIRRAVAEVDPRQPVSHVQTMDEAVAAKMAEPRVSAALLAAFGALALLLAAAGTFAVFSYAVSRRTPEIGLRLALGAQRHQVLALVLRGSLRLTLIGVVAGVAAAWPVTHWLASLLFGVEPIDPLTISLVITLVVGSALLACVGPARRAIGIDPTMALRAE